MASVDTAPLGPLNPGNVVSAALRLYRDRFKTYMSLSARAALWAFVPVYGWAKYFMLMGVMARLAFQDLINQPETTQQAHRQVNAKLWSFLVLGLLVGLIFVAAYLVLVIVGLILAFVFGGILGGVLSVLLGSQIGAIVGALLGFLVFVAIFLLGMVWLVSRLLIAEVPLAIESQIDVSDSIGRSWQLTKRSIMRIQFVVVAAFLITLPILSVTSFAPQIALVRLEPGSSAYWTLYAVIMVLGFLANIVILPFWQTVKGVLYYDLRSRREGLDLKQ
ncbi:MAG: hypothetical protein AAGE59_18600 [Cyanobacteria bacterium P01_F01_bin.86]